MDIRTGGQKCSMIWVVHRWIKSNLMTGLYGICPPPSDVARRPAARKWRSLDRSERTNGGETPLKEQGAGTTLGRTGEYGHRIDTKTQQSDRASSALSPYYCGRFHGGSTAIFSLKIAPKHNTKICCPSTPAVTADWADFFMIGADMPRMSKKRKLELSFFLNERGRVAHNGLCRKCRHVWQTELPGGHHRLPQVSFQTSQEKGGRLNGS